MARKSSRARVSTRNVPAIAAALGAFIVAAALAAGLSQAWHTRDAPLLTMYRQRGCECCLRWAAYMRKEGFRVDVRDEEPLADVRARLGVPEPLAACHTATVGRYVIEGHVPVADVRRLLEDKTDLRGIAVPGMPADSPGMESARRDTYEVIGFDGAGHQRVIARHGPGADGG